MKLIVTDVRLKFDEHKSLILAEWKRTLIERILKRPIRLQYFIGSGTRWNTYPEFKPVAKSIAEQLQAVEKRWQHIKRLNPRADFKTIARIVHKQTMEP